MFAESFVTERNAKLMAASESLWFPVIPKHLHLLMAACFTNQSLEDRHYLSDWR